MFKEVMRNRGSGGRMREMGDEVRNVAWCQRRLLQALARPCSFYFSKMKALGNYEQAMT